MTSSPIVKMMSILTGERIWAGKAVYQYGQIGLVSAIKSGAAAESINAPMTR